MENRQAPPAAPDGQVRTEAVSTFAALRDPRFRWIWAANVISGIGSMMHATAASWMLVEEAGAATLVTLLQTMASLPVFLFALPAGALADILNKRQVVLAAQTAGFVTATVLTVLAGFGLAHAPVLLGSAFLLGLAAAFGFPAWQALLPELVSPPRWPSAITLGSISVNLSRSLGPVAGGVLIGLAPPAVVFGINALSFLAVLTALWLTRPPATAQEKPPDTDAEPFFSAMAAAVRHIRYSPAIRRVLGGQAAYVFLAVAPLALLPLIARELGLQGLAFGALSGVYGLGGILTAFILLPRLRRAWTPDRILAASGLTSLAAAAGLAAADSLWLAVPMLLLAGAAWMTSMSQYTISGQTSFPHWVRARASAVQLMVSQGAYAAGAVVWGQLTQHGSLHLALAVTAAGLGLAVLHGCRRPLLPLLPKNLTPHPHVPRHGGFITPPAPSDGPVLVEVSYHIRREDTSAFVHAAQAMRGVRLRDGAFRWGLYRDPAHPDFIREVFLVEDWGTHLRQHARFSGESHLIEKQLLKFHLGPGPPAVTHSLRLHPKTLTPPPPGPASAVTAAEAAPAPVPIPANPPV